METILLLVKLLVLNWVLAINAKRPFKLDYVHQFPWDKSTSNQVINEANCCQTLHSLLGVGFSQYLKDSFVFEFLNNAYVASYFETFQEQLEFVGLSADLVANCFGYNTSLFVSISQLCALAELVRRE